MLLTQKHTSFGLFLFDIKNVCFEIACTSELIIFFFLSKTESFTLRIRNNGAKLAN